MKKLMMLVAGGIMSVTMPLMADTWTDTSTGYTWRYRIKDGTAEIFTEIYCCTMPDYAISPSPEGAVTIPDTLGGKPVTSIGYCAFDGCSGLTSITIPASVTSIGEEAFAGCSGLTNIMIPAGVTNISDSAFCGCDGLADTNGFIIVRNVLYGYVGTETSVTIPDDVTGIGYSAFGYSGLTRVTIPSSVTSIGASAFAGCRDLTSITIPASVTSIGEEAFAGCSGLTNIMIPASVTSISDSAFYGCDGLADKNGFIIVRNVLYGYVGTETSVTIPDDVTGIGCFAFSGCENLASVTIPASVTSIGEGAFSSCIGLASVTIPASVTNIGDWAFSSCIGLASVTIPASVTNIGDYAFSCCENLASVTIPASVTSIGEGALSGCSGLLGVIFMGNAPAVGDYAFDSVNEDCTVYVTRTSIGWGVEIPGTWSGINIQYLTPDVEIAVANETGRGTVEIDGELSDTEVASGVTLVVKGENLDAAELAAKITPRPHEDGQSASLFKVKAEPVAGGVSLAVVLDEEAVDPDATAAEIVGSESVAAFGAAAEGENVPVSLPSAKPGLYYGIAAVNDLSQMDAAAASAPLVRAGAGGVAVPVAKPAGTSAFFKVIVSDRAR